MNGSKPWESILATQSLNQKSPNYNKGEASFKKCILAIGL